MPKRGKLTLIISEILYKKRLSQYWLAVQTGISQPTISKLASGYTGSITLDVLGKISAALEMEPGDLIQFRNYSGSYSIPEAAKLLGLSRGSAYYYVEHGKLKPAADGRITKAEISRFRRSRAVTGRGTPSAAPARPA